MKSPFESDYHEHYTSGDNFIRRFARNRLRLTPRVRPLFRHIRDLQEHASVLDVGCGTGGLLELIEGENPGLSLFGLDLTRPAGFRAHSAFVAGSALALPFRDASFEVVLCAHVLEHLADPFVALGELRRVAVADGLVYVETPSHRSVAFGFGHSFWDDPTHVRPYSPEALRRAMQHSGLRPVAWGIKRSWAGILLGLPYAVVGAALGDTAAREIFAANAFGFVAYGIGRRDA